VASVLVSGGTSGLGLGLAVARHLRALGDEVWVLGTTAAGVAAATGPGGASGGSVCDVTDEAAVALALSEMCAALGAVDGAFVNAGIDGGGVAAVDLDADHFLRVLDVNVRGSFLVARHAARAMRAAHPVAGSIVLNASVNALRPEPLFADYNASKAAVVALAKTLALELAPEIAVTAIAPGYFPSRMTDPYLSDPEKADELRSLIPAARFGDPGELAALVAFLLSPAAAYMTGGVITIDGGRSA
jgi:NAD(P)-dependent dehydrogenase (short-subunit alcohol dehydrogenase family)